MRIITKTRLTSFYTKHVSAKPNLLSWYKVSRNAKWKNLVQLKASFPAADLVGKFTVFNISGNRYRLIAYIDYTYQTIFIRHVLTHSEYDRDEWKDDDWYT